MLARIILILTLSGCYELKSAVTQGKVLLSRRYIYDILQNDTLDDEKKRKLRLVLKARDFAKSLDLNVGRSYDTLSLRPAKLWVLMAAKKDSLTPYTWSYPIVGSVPYKGFFKEEDAMEFQSKYPEYDTHIRTSSAFSSLGWFDDPITPNLLDLPDTELTETLFHELFHRTVWIKDEVAKNESGANIFGVLANINFYRNDPEKLQKARASLTHTLALAQDLKKLVDSLNAVFNDNSKSYEEKLALKEQLYKDSKLPLSPNNAELLHLWIYYEYVENYKDLFIKNDRSLSSFLNNFKKAL